MIIVNWISEYFNCVRVNFTYHFQKVADSAEVTDQADIDIEFHVCESAIMTPILSMV